jgi:hypothetical protein
MHRCYESTTRYPAGSSSSVYLARLASYGRYSSCCLQHWISDLLPGDAEQLSSRFVSRDAEQLASRSSRPACLGRRKKEKGPDTTYAVEGKSFASTAPYTLGRTYVLSCALGVCYLIWNPANRGLPSFADLCATATQYLTQEVVGQGRRPGAIDVRDARG